LQAHQVPERTTLARPLRHAIAIHQYSRRTEEAYVSWIRRYVVFHGKRASLDPGRERDHAFLSDLAVRGRVTASTQNQALSALLFLYRVVLGQDVAGLDDIVRAKRFGERPRRPVACEVAAVLAHLRGTPRLMASLMYGSGLRLLECARCG